MNPFHIVIGSYAGSPWLADAVAALPKDIPSIVVLEPNYECGKIGWVWRHTDIEEFLYLPDTAILKRHDWIYNMRDAEGQSMAVSPEPAPYGCFMGKYRRVVLDEIGVPTTPDKRSACDAEQWWCRTYYAKAGEMEGVLPPIIFPDFQHGPNPARIEMRHGRRNAVWWRITPWWTDACRFSPAACNRRPRCR